MSEMGLFDMLYLFNSQRVAWRFEIMEQAEACTTATRPKLIFRQTTLSIYRA